jgi:uncharacterized protein
VSELIHADHVAARPWRNGGGRTRELLAWPSAADWHLRISLADIERDGPFSAFPGVQRWFAVLEGAGVLLRFGDAEERVTRDSGPVCFDGAAAPGCSLVDGPTLDLNLMLRHGSAGAMHAAEHGREWTPATARCGLFAAVPGMLRCGTQAWMLPARTLLWFEQSPAGALAFRADRAGKGTIGWWLGFTPRDR